MKTSKIHIIAYSVYLPTSGQDDEFIEELSRLTHDISEHKNRSTVIVIGADTNTSIKSTKRRQEAFKNFMNEFNLKSIIDGDKPTFHHNNGTSESQIDHLLTNNTDLVSLSKHLCKLDDETNLSSHDALIGRISLDNNEETFEKDYSDTYEVFEPEKILWKDSQEYEDMTANILHQLLSTYDQPEHLPVLAEMSSKMIAICAKKCFESKKSKATQKKTTPKFSQELNGAYQEHKQNCNNWRKAGRPQSADHPAKYAKLISQRKIQKISRDEEANQARANHDDLMATHHTNISEVCKKVKKIIGETAKTTDIPEIETLVGKFKGNNVLEGFRANTEYLCNDKTSKNFSDQFLNRCNEDLIIINEISKHEDLRIPPMNTQDLQKIIKKKFKNNKACDIYQITPEHFKYAGEKFLEPLCTLINRVLRNLSFFAAPEFKVSIASVISKGKGKSKTHHKSYRLVRVCPLIGRIIDEYIRPMAVQLSKPLQSNNQYGFTENITYLMGGLQRHEAQKYCIDTKQTFFGCSLDGDSAFEVVCRAIQKRELYFSGEIGQLAIYNHCSYNNTQTRIKMSRKISQPLTESLGVGQGKIRSSDHYKIYINPALETLERAQLGINIGPINTGLSCVADDLYLLTNDQIKLQGLLDIAQHYGQQYRIEYGASKTVISVVGSKKDMKYYKDIQPWKMDDLPVSVKDDNDHLGLVVSGDREEEKNVDLKIKKARGALFKLLGPAFSSKCLLSPQLQIHLFRIFVCPIARSGLSAMTLRDNHLNPLTSFQRKVIRGFLHLSDRSPIPSLFFLTGELPIAARLHRDIFSLFYNIWINPETKIFKIIQYLLQNCPQNSHTWARHIKNLSSMYGIEDPSKLISEPPPSKPEFKNYINTMITVYHEKKLRAAAATNSKMTYLNVSIKGLNGKPHAALLGIVTTQTVQKSRAHLKMLTDDLYTYEKKAKYQGGSSHCRLCTSPDQTIKNTEDLEHIITTCNTYHETRSRILIQMEIICMKAKNDINFKTILQNKRQLTQFILDCTSLNLERRISEYDEICPMVFNLSRDLCYNIMKKRNNAIKLLKS